MSSLLGGFAAWYATPVGYGWDLQPIAPNRITCDFDGAWNRVWSLDGTPAPLVFPASNPELSLPGLLIAPHLIVPDIARPLGPLQAARYALNGYLDVEAYSADIIATGRGESGGYLWTAAEITPETAERWSTRWTDRDLKGVRVLGNGLELRNSLLNPSDAQWLESREFNAQEIGRMFNVPPRYLGLPSGDASTYATARDNDVAFYRFSVTGFVDPIAEAWSQLLPFGLTESEDVRIVFDPSRWLEPSDLDRNTSDNIAIVAGIKTADEIRAERGLPPLNRQEVDTGARTALASA